MSERLRAARRLSARSLAGDVGAVERIEEDDGVRYTNIMLLSPGEWTDAGSGETLYYAPEAIEASADNWVDPGTGEPISKAQLNMFHDPRNPSQNVGYVDVDSVYAEDGNMYGDCVLHLETTASRDADGLMKAALRSEGEVGMGGVSVEIPADVTEYDKDKGLERMVEMWFSGVGFVMEPASESVSFDQQLEGRAVALSSPGEEYTVFTPSGRTDISDDDRSSSMERHETLLARIEANRRTLQDIPDEEGPGGEDAPAEPDEDEEAFDIEVAAGVLSQFMEVVADEDDMEADMDTFMAWASENVDESAMEDVTDAINQYNAEAEGGDGEASLDGFVAYVQEKLGDGDGEEEEEEEADDDVEAEYDDKDDEDDDETDMEALRAEVESLSAVVEDMAVLMEETTAHLEATATEKRDLEGRLSDMADRLEKVEGEPVNRTLAGGAVGDEYDEDEDGADRSLSDTETARRTADGYLTGSPY